MFCHEAIRVMDNTLWNCSFFGVTDEFVVSVYMRVYVSPQKLTSFHASQACDPFCRSLLLFLQRK